MTVRLRRISKLLNEPPELTRLVTIVGSQVLPAVRFFDIVCQSVRLTQINGLREQIVGAFAIFTTELEGRDPS